MFMRSRIFLMLFVAFSTIVSAQSLSKVAAGTVTKMNRTEFISEVFDHTKPDAKWEYKGTTPMIIDFYADWCGPCKRIAPILDELAKEYKGKVRIVKVDTEVERKLAGELGVQSLPTLLFVPAKGDPQAVMGLKSKAELVTLIGDILKVK